MGGHLHPEIEGEQHCEDGGGFVIIASGHRTRDVGGNQTHESRCQQGRIGAARGLGVKDREEKHLVGEEIGRNGGGCGEDGRNEHAHVADLNREVQHVQHLVEEVGSAHHTGVRSTSYNTTQRIPGAIIHPVEELVGSRPRQELCGTVVEPGIVLVNNLRIIRHHDFLLIRSERQRRDESKTTPDR